MLGIKCYLISLILSFQTFAATAKDLSKTDEILTLEMAIKKAMTSNWDLLQFRNSLRSQKIDYDNAFDKMFIPVVSLAATVSSNYSFAQLPGSTAATLGAAQDPSLLDSSGKTAASYTFSKGYPTTAIGVTVGQYTLFNFFKDQLVYEAARLTWERNQQKLIEKERDIRFQVINEYFKNRTEQEKLEAASRSVEISEAILELVQSKEALGTAKSTDVSSSTVDYLNAKNQMNSQERNVVNERWALNLLMGESISNKYTLRTDLEYTPLQLELDDATKLFAENSPSARDVKLNVKTSELNLSLVEKTRLPLPTISISPISIMYGNQYWGDSRTNTASAAGSSANGNIDFITSVNFTIPLYGPGGFLSKRTVETARITRDNADLAFQQTMMNSLVVIQQGFANIKNQEQAVQLNKDSIQNASKLLEILFSNFSKSGANRLELRDAINQARSIEFSYKDAILEHLRLKLLLAQTIGVDHLPGEFF